MSTVKHLIFDLDDTLLDTTGLLIPIKDTPEFFKKIESELPLMPGALQNLMQLKSKYHLHLLTQGRPHLQAIKLKSLAIEPFFETVTIIDPAQQQSKADYFKKFKESCGCQPDQVISIGNRKSTDLGPAKEVGFKTCWFAYGEHVSEPEMNFSEKPDFIIYNHFEMIKVCQL